ncbi:hypothetical protein N8307_11945 [Planktomarina temperata]|jgi:hypothetical protein|nr:hypothetical protein [Planktomarina temperata]
MDDASFKGPPFALVSKNFWQEFVENEDEGEASEMKGQALLEVILESERARRGVTNAGATQDAVDYETLEALKNADSDNPKLAHAMLTFRKLATNPTKAVEYVERLITSRQTEISQKMTDIASKQRPGGRKPFAKIIDEIVKQNPNISCHSLLQRLKKHEEISVIDNKIICHEPHDEMPVSGLSQALSRSKARLIKIKHSR